MSNLLCERSYQVWPDHVQSADQWYLHDPLTVDGEEIDPRAFTAEVKYRGPLPVIVPVTSTGREVAFHLATFLMPVVSETVAAIIARIAPGGTECFPVKVPGSKGTYVILNVICALDCLDEEKSEFTRWTKEDERPDRLGQYHVISTIRIDPSRTGDHHIFRIKHWPLALLVSGTLKDSLDGVISLGVVFKPAV